ncbi:MAG: head morphogenesis protein [Burkholderiaceae bacterium]|jgi:hypothetical protein|nr:head morphogenesis protein [Burkholderiaceae bacterium]
MADDTPAQEAIDGARQQFAEQIAFLRRKLNLPTETWRSIERAAHDRAFVVAGVMKADLLHDLRRAVDAAVQGGSIGQFRKDFDAIVAKHGWTGWTGEGSRAGKAWRTRVIYQTNILTSVAAGRRAQLMEPEFLKRRPYWRYVHDDGVMHARPLHKQWGDMRLTLRHDDPFWATHYPPNGWGCRCRVVAVARPAEGDATAPPAGWQEKDPRTGAPVGLDEGWDYAPGAGVDTELRQLVQDKLISYPPAIGKALSAEIKRTINAEERIEDFVERARTGLPREEDLWIGFIEPQAAAKVKELTKEEVAGFTVILPSGGARHVEMEHGHDGGSQRPPRPEDYAHVLDILNAAAMRLTPDLGRQQQKRVTVSKEIGSETFYTIWEIMPGKRNRSLKLVTLYIKTGAKKKPRAP